MHELSIAQSIVESAREHAAAHAGRRVLRIGVRVGDISGVNADALAFCFGMTTAGTDMEGAALDIERVPAACRCEQCGSDFPARDFSMACPRCASPRIVIAGGDELALAYLEIEDDGRGEAPSEGARS